MKYSIKIPKPCHEDWGKMTPTEQGRFCAHCQKEVLDFTRLSDAELLKKIKPDAQMCGRFRPTQLNRGLDCPRKRKFRIIKLFLGIAPFLSLPQLVFSQTVKPRLEIASVEGPLSEKVSPEKFMTITGQVLHEGVPLEGVRIFQKGGSDSTYSDVFGDFSFQINIHDAGLPKILTFSAMDMETEQVSISQTTKQLKVDMLRNFGTVKEIEIVSHAIPIYSNSIGGAISVTIEKKTKKSKFIRAITAPFRHIKNIFKKK